MATVTKLAGKRSDVNGWVFGNVGGTALANGDQSQPIEALDWRPEKSWQVTGTFGVGGSVQLEKSNDGTNWVISGTALTAAGFAVNAEVARYFRFNVTAGDGTTALFVTLVGVEQKG